MLESHTIRMREPVALGGCLSSYLPVIVAIFSAYCTLAIGWLSSAYRAEKSDWLSPAYCMISIT